MANKKTIDDINVQLDRWHKKLTTAVVKINELRGLRKKIREGKIKQPAPKGVIVKIPNGDKVSYEDFDDVIPTFGSNGAGFGSG